jgi:hypothetical protein
MKNNTYIQLGLAAVALSLLFLRTREGFEAFTEAKCPDGSDPLPLGMTTRPSELCAVGEGTDPVCPTDWTWGGEAKKCTYINPDGSETTGADRICTGSKTLDRVKNKCFDTVPICPTTSDRYSALLSPGMPKTICVPKTSNTYAPTLPTDRAWRQDDIRTACRTGDVFMFGSSNTVKCLSMTDTTAGATAGTTTAATTAATTSQSHATDQTVASKFRQVIDSLKPFRPPTAPSSDLEKERREITDAQKTSLFYIQLALFIVVLALLGYVLLPVDVAHGSAFLLLCVGISLGFFLRK